MTIPKTALIAESPAILPVSAQTQDPKTEFQPKTAIIAVSKAISPETAKSPDAKTGGLTEALGQEALKNAIIAMA